MSTLAERVAELEIKMGQIQGRVYDLARVRLRESAQPGDLDELKRWRAMFSSPEVCAQELERLRNMVESSEFYSTLRARASDRAPA